MISLSELRRIMPYATNENLEKYHEPLTDAMREFEIDSPPRIAAFLAQVGHESGSLRYVRELDTGEAYEGRKDLGNTEPGDGVRYKGRGLIQITGRANYQACGAALDLDLVGNPELLEQPVPACRSAGWFWTSRGLNAFADKGDFLTITKRINGGTNGWKDRTDYYERAKEVLCLA